MAIKKKTRKKPKKRTGTPITRSTKTKYDGIEFASRWESVMYKRLKEAGIKFTYEGQSYETFEAFELDNDCYERATKRSKGMTDRRKVTKVSYTPDFIGENEEWFIEVKGRANESFSIRWKLFKRKMSERDNPPIIFKPMSVKDIEQTVEILKQKGYGKK